MTIRNYRGYQMLLADHKGESHTWEEWKHIRHSYHLGAYAKAEICLEHLFRACVLVMQAKAGEEVTYKLVEKKFEKLEKKA